MDEIEATKRLTHRGVMKMLAAGADAAEASGQPQCIVVVDASGEPLGEIRMTGAKFLSRRTALAKAMTAASHGIASGDVPEAVRPAVAAATGGALTGLAGGLPILIDGLVLGGIGVGSGSPDEDLAVARAALASVGADPV